MKKSSSRNDQYESLAKKFIIFLAFLVILAIGIVRRISEEDICTNNASTIVGKNWTKPIKITEQDRENIPYLARFMQSDNTIVWGMKETLICEKNYKPFFLF